MREQSISSPSRMRIHKSKLQSCLLVMGLILLFSVTCFYLLDLNDKWERDSFFVSALEENNTLWDVYSKDIAIDSENNVYVIDGYNVMIQKFDSNGSHITSWGSEGIAKDQFKYPQEIAIDSENNVYVIDMGNNRIQKFDSNGSHITSWGSEGNNPGLFHSPQSLAIDSENNVYVADTFNNRIQKFDRNGNFIEILECNPCGLYQNEEPGSYFQKSASILWPIKIAVDSSQNLYIISDYDSRDIMKFDKNNRFLTLVGSNGAGKINYPASLSFDSDDNVYVVDNADYDPKISKFNSSGTFIGEIASKINDTAIAFSNRTSEDHFSTDWWDEIILDQDTLNNPLSIQDPTDIAIDSSQNMFVVDNHRVIKIDKNSTFIQTQ